MANVNTSTSQSVMSCSGLAGTLPEAEATKVQASPQDTFSDDSTKGAVMGWQGVCRVAAEAIRDFVAIGEEAPTEITKSIQRGYRCASKAAGLAISEIEKFPSNTSFSAVVHFSAVKAVAESISLIEPNRQYVDFASIENIIFNSLSLAEELADSEPLESNLPHEVAASTGGHANE